MLISAKNQEGVAVEGDLFCIAFILQEEDSGSAMEDFKNNKVVLVGDFGVGKTTIFTRFKTGQASGGSLNTRKECECTKNIKVDGKETCVSQHEPVQPAVMLI